MFFSALVLQKKITVCALLSSSVEKEVTLASSVNFIHICLQVFSLGHENKENRANEPAKPLNSMIILCKV
jgi:hypothetical protein